ncbi:hypothetical protein [uncultured Sphingomonas sp.]|uniref:hypothetical protein n=1 Tax=uncultured Sphingomonas sp. TaxID=158754 RepID=UPI0035CC2051
MDQDLDRLLGRLAAQPVPERLNRLEGDVMRRIAAARHATTPAWRAAAVGLALAVGLGVGGAAAAGGSRSAPLGLELANGAGLAPSALLGRTK